MRETCFISKFRCTNVYIPLEVDGEGEAQGVLGIKTQVDLTLDYWKWKNPTNTQTTKIKCDP